MCVVTERAQAPRIDAANPGVPFERVKKHTSYTRDDKRLPSEYTLMSYGHSRGETKYRSDQQIILL